MASSRPGLLTLLRTSAVSPGRGQQFESGAKRTREEDDDHGWDAVYARLVKALPSERLRVEDSCMQTVRVRGNIPTLRTVVEGHTAAIASLLHQAHRAHANPLVMHRVEFDNIGEHKDLHVHMMYHPDPRK